MWNPTELCPAPCLTWDTLTLIKGGAKTLRLFMPALHERVLYTSHIEI